MSAPTDTLDELDELDALLAAATPGPWENPRPFTKLIDAPGITDNLAIVQCDNAADAALIVALRNRAADLLAAIRAAYALAEEWQNRPGTAGDGYASGVTTGERRCGAALTVALRAVLDEALGASGE